MNESLLEKKKRKLWELEGFEHVKEEIINSFKSRKNDFARMQQVNSARQSAPCFFTCAQTVM